MAITYALEGGSALSDQLGIGHIIAGKVTGSAGTDAVLTSNDRSLTMSRTAAGDYTVTWGDTFIGTPVLTATPVSTFATTGGVTTQILSMGTASARIQTAVLTLATATTALSAIALTDLDFYFTVVGKRYV